MIVTVVGVADVSVVVHEPLVHVVMAVRTLGIDIGVVFMSMVVVVVVSVVVLESFVHMLMSVRRPDQRRRADSHHPSTKKVDRAQSAIESDDRDRNAREWSRREDHGFASCTEMP